MEHSVYTIGHSTQSQDRFISLLHAAKIDVVTDVRSSPYSRMNAQFNRDELKQRLKKENIKYLFLGKELGARSNHDCVYVRGQAKYELIAQTESFQDGIKRVVEGAKKYRVALMCAEKEPLECHRTILVSRKLIEHGLTVCHILNDGTTESHDHALDRLVARLGIPPEDMLRPRSQVVEEAYDKQGLEIAYRDPEKAIEASYRKGDGTEFYP